MKRLTKAALGSVAGFALVLSGTGVASGALLDFLKIHRNSNDIYESTVTLDSAKAKITIDKGTDSTTFTIRVTGIDLTGIDPSMVGKPLGSHLHTGKCVEGDFGVPTASPSPLQPGWQAGPHYNHDVVVGGKKFPGLDVPPEQTATISTETEVWFDLLPDEEGMAYDKTTVPFVPVDPDGDMSVVVHVLSTNTKTGGAGTRQACFPLSVAGIFPKTPPSPTE